MNRNYTNRAVKISQHFLSCFSQVNKSWRKSESMKICGGELTERQRNGAEIVPKDLRHCA